MNSTDLEQLIDELRSLPNETEWVEFKENYSNPDVIGQYISAVSNSATMHSKNFGYVVFGIEDKTHNIVGTTFQPKLITKNKQELETWFYQMLSPQPAIEFLECEIGVHRIVVLKVSRALWAPVKFDGVAYIRHGSINRKLSDFVQQERQLWRLLNGMSFEDGVAVEGVRKDKIIELIDLQAYFDLMSLPTPTSFDEMIQKFLDEDLIAQMGSKFNITNVCGILFAKNLIGFPG